MLFLFCSYTFLRFRPVHGLASFISLHTPVSNIPLLLGSIHLGWGFPLSPITMATATAGCHWTLYNIPREAEAKAVDKKRVQQVKRGMNGLRSGREESKNECDVTEKLRGKLGFTYPLCTSTKQSVKRWHAPVESTGGSTGVGHCIRDNVSNWGL